MFKPAVSHGIVPAIPPALDTGVDPIPFILGCGIISIERLVVSATRYAGGYEQAVPRGGHKVEKLIVVVSVNSRADI